MKIEIIGGGPAGLYFAILMKREHPGHIITVYERNRPDDTFGFGVVFSDATLENIAAADFETYQAITEHFARWDDIDIHYQGEVLTSTGHGFCGLSRKTLLSLLQERARKLDVNIHFETDIRSPEQIQQRLRAADLVILADGVNSLFRETYAEQFRPHIDWRPNRFLWLGTTLPLTAFTFLFRPCEHGLFRVHAYRYDSELSTFIVETTEEAWKSAGLDKATEEESVAFCENLFKEDLQGHRLLNNRSIWRSFPTIKNERWCYKNMVLMGDAAHTAHYSIGSGTKLAMEDAIALVQQLRTHQDIPAALAAYDVERRQAVESTQRAAQVSLQWFEETERYFGRLEPLQFAFSLLTRSLRITHENLALRDPKFMARVDAWTHEQAEKQVGCAIPARDVKDPTTQKLVRRLPPPMFTPFRLRDLVLENRVVVSPMCQYSAEDGLINDWHLVHMGSRALGGAGLLMTEMTDISPEGRITLGCAGMYRDDQVGPWKRMVDFVHTHSRAKIGMQLAHAGRKASTVKPWEGSDDPLETGGWEILAPSPIPYKANSHVPREMSREDMIQVRDDFVRATERAEAAGFDIIELHMAHGYLLNTFLSPLTNRRSDEYGGSVENRMRFPLEVFRAVRAVWPEHKPMSVRISATDWATGGFTPKDAVILARTLQSLGLDILDVSAGQVVTEAKPVYGRLFQTPFSELVRLETGIPTMTVGAISSYADVNSIIAAGRADLCALARAHLYDPYWTRHAATEQNWPMDWPNQYLTVSRYTPRFK